METIVLAAGKGTRMRSELPKVLHPVFGKPVLGYVFESLAAAGMKHPYVVVGHQAEKVRSFSKEYGANAVFQREQKGTGHAVMMAKAVLRNAQGPLLVCPGDMPLVRPETLSKFLTAHKKSRAHVSVLSCVREDPFGYGRIVRDEGRFSAIREELDAAPEERAIGEVNTGIYLFDRKVLFEALENVGQDNKKEEYYLTDTIEILRRKGYCVEAFLMASAEEGQGINSQNDLAVVTKKIKEREIARHQGNGVTFWAPDQTFVAPGVKIGKGTIIYPWCFIQSDVQIGEDCEVGPFAKLRSGTVIGEGSSIGSFVEVCRSRLGKKVLAKHLTYLGDAVIGEGANIGAGTITANFDGKKKNRTFIGKNVKIGSNTVFVAPVRIPDGARTGAGSVVIPKTKIKKGDVVVGVPARPVSKKKR